MSKKENKSCFVLRRDFNCLKQVASSVAESGVVFYTPDIICMVPGKIWRGPGRPKYICNLLLVKKKITHIYMCIYVYICVYIYKDNKCAKQKRSMEIIHITK